MTESRVPRTEAGRRLVAWQGGINGFDREYWDKRVVEIEDQAAQPAPPLDVERLLAALRSMPTTFATSLTQNGPEVVSRYARRWPAMTEDRVPPKCQTWGYYSGRQCVEDEGHEGRHRTEPAVGRDSAGKGSAQ